MQPETVLADRTFLSSSVCTPSRYICLTGQYASRCQSERFLQICSPGTQSNVGFNVSVTPGSLNIGKVLHDAGYTTGFVGKWHTGTPPLVKYKPDADMGDPRITPAGLLPGPLHVQASRESIYERLKTWLGQFDRPFGDFRP